MILYISIYQVIFAQPKNIPLYCAQLLEEKLEERVRQEEEAKREEESKSQSLACPYFYDRNVVLAFNRLKALGKLELRKPLLKNDTFTATIPTRATFFRTLECT